MPDDLRAVQARFYQLVTAAEGVGPTLAQAGQSAADLRALVRGEDPVARLDVYANMYFFRILDVLRDAYPKVAALVGDAAFHNLATLYLVACPPAHANIGEVGARLPRYLSEHPADPGAAELAAIERAYSEVFEGPDAPTLSLADVQAKPAEEVPSLALKLIPCHRLLSHRPAVAELWQALEEGEADPPAPVDVEETVLVWRQDVEVFHRVVSPEERPLLEAAARGTTIAALCDTVVAASYAEAAQQVFHQVATWLQHGLVQPCDK